MTPIQQLDCFLWLIAKCPVAFLALSVYQNDFISDYFKGHFPPALALSTGGLCVMLSAFIAVVSPWFGAEMMSPRKRTPRRFPVLVILVVYRVHFPLLVLARSAPGGLSLSPRPSRRGG